MIEKSVMQYLLSLPDLRAMVNGRIYYRQAPTTPDVKMPYIVVSNAGGMRNKRTQVGPQSSADDTLGIYVETTDQFQAKTIADRIVGALENYRGRIGDEYNAHFRCGTPRDLAGFQGNFRNLVQVYVEYWFVTNVPH